MTLLINNGTIVTMDEKRRIIKEGAVLVQDNIITEVGKMDEVKRNYSVDVEIDADGGLILPGFINIHTHVAMTICKGLAEESSPERSSLYELMFPINNFLSKDDFYSMALIGSSQILNFGTTCVAENAVSAESVARAIDQTGLRAVISELVYDVDLLKLRDGIYEYSPERGEKTLKEATRIVDILESDGRIRGVFGPLAPDMCTQDLLKKLLRVARERNKMVTMHVAQSQVEMQQMNKMYGMRPVEYLYRLGILSKYFVATHCVNVNDDEIQLLKETGTNIAHCPVMIATRGMTAPLLQFLDAGINVGMGTDNFFGDMLDCMRLATLIARIRSGQGSRPTPMKVLETATINGARALGLENEIGSIEIGKKADIITVDMKKPHLAPKLNYVSNLIHYGNGGDVKTVIVDGRILKKNGIITSIDLVKVLAESQKTAEEVWRRFYEFYGKK
jgi:5-methylthioadenosine/S-adenosylhomocysteine deaminase